MCHLLKYKFSHKFINVPRKALEDIKFQASIIDIEENFVIFAIKIDQKCKFQVCGVV